MFAESDKIISQLNKDNTEMKQVFEIFVERKETWFKEYKKSDY